MAKKKQEKLVGPRNTVSCVYCGKQVTKRKSMALEAQPQYRICCTHVCLICGQPLRPEDAISALVKKEGGEVVGDVHRSHIYKPSKQRRSRNKFTKKRSA